MSRAGPLLLLLASSAASADVDGGVLPPQRVQVRADPEKVKLGEPFTVEIVVTHDPSQRYELGAPGDLGDFDFAGQERSRVDGKDSSTTTFKVRLQAYALGKQRTPALSLEVSEAGGEPRQLSVGGAEVEIVSTLPPDAQKTGANLYDVRPPEVVPVRTWRLLYALGALLAAGLLGWALYRWLTRPRSLAAPERPPEPLHLRATRALDELREQNLPGQGRGREFYFRLSEILRAYLGELYRFEALESTTPELLEALRTRRTPGLPVSELTTFATWSDMVRYAKTVPNPDDCKLALELGYRIVHATTVALPPPAPVPPKAPHAAP